MESTDETQTNEVRCLCCQKLIEEKPWITLSCDNGDFHIHGCSYLCSKHVGKYMGGPYWDKVVNKEDFLKDLQYLKNRRKYKLRIM